MDFSNKFKFRWWILLLIILSMVSAWRLYVGIFNNTDIFIFLFWFILVLFPIISEISLFGINVKKDIETAKNEIKSYVNDIKNEIRNQNNLNQTINNYSSVPANKDEYKEKAIREIKSEDVAKAEEVEKREQDQKHKRKDKTYNFIKEPIEQKKTDNVKVQDRLNKIAKIETLVGNILKSVYGERYKPQMKIIDTDTGETLVVDGVIYKEDLLNIAEIVEIKFITRISFSRFYYLALDYAKKLFKFGLKISIRYILVSEDIDDSYARDIKEQVTRINYFRSINRPLAHMEVQTFSFDGVQLKEL